MTDCWSGFRPGQWQETIEVRDFIQRNYTPYTGDESFLAPATQRTQAVMKKLNNLLSLEREFGGVLDIDTTTVTSLLTYKPGYLDKDREIIVGLQTDRPLKRGVNPFGGIRMVRSACKAYGYELSPQVEEEFRYRTTHNDGVFRVYNEETKAARHCGLITGLPDAYGRGRIIGDYRRVALYGIDRLVEEKKANKARIGQEEMTEENIRLLEELSSYNNGERLNLTTTGMTSWLRTLALSFAASLIDTPIEFVSRIDPDLPVLPIDQVKVRQALFNLLGNAREALSDGAIPAPVLTFSAKMQASGHQLVLTVSDNGCGIAPEDLDTLFEPFVTHKPGGTGLGLAFVRRVFRALFGVLGVFSERG